MVPGPRVQCQTAQSCFKALQIQLSAVEKTGPSDAQNWALRQCKHAHSIAPAHPSHWVAQPDGHSMAVHSSSQFVKDPTAKPVVVPAQKWLVLTWGWSAKE